MRMKIVDKGGKFPSTRKHLAKTRAAQSLDGKPSGGEPAFPRGLEWLHPDADRPQEGWRQIKET
jgi:hypothetical protein